MVAWKPFQDSSAFRLYCKGIGKDISEYDDIAKDLDSYREDRKWKAIIERSQRFVGVIESISESPCSMLLFDKPVRNELGIVRTSKGKICCLLDGYNCDKFKYLKNDYLTVTVWAIIRDVCREAGIQIPTIRELDNLLDDDTFNVYRDGLTCTINQADSDYATGLVKTYQPKSVSEMSAFVAIIRPGCASLLQDFINRRPYTTGVTELDELLIEGSHRMIYQELIMKYLIWLGTKESKSYDIIKSISKKRFKEAELNELKKQLHEGWVYKVKTMEGFVETWTVVEQAAKYSFNASHSLSYAYDSLYGAYLKSHYPLEYYTVALNYYGDDSERTLKLTNELSHFGIQLKPPKFRYSDSRYTLSKEDNSIYKGVGSIKEMGAAVADEIYQLRRNQYQNFMEVLIDLKENTKANKTQITKLIELDFFSEFGDINKLLRQYELFDKFYGKKQVKRADLEFFGIDPECAEVYAVSASAKIFKMCDDQTNNMNRMLIGIAEYIHYVPVTLRERIRAQVEHLGYVDIFGEQYSGMAVVIEVDTKYSPKVKMYSLKNGTTLDCKISKQVFNKCKLEKGELVKILGQNRKAKQRKNEDGEWVIVPGVFDIWITKYQKVSNL